MIAPDSTPRLRALLGDFGVNARSILAALPADLAEVARRLGKLGIAASFARGPLAEADRRRLESVYLRIADRSDDAPGALRSLDLAEAEAFRRVALDAIGSIFGDGAETAQGFIRGP